MNDVRIYRFNHDGHRYYGQGTDEEYVRLALESKLNVDKLEKGTDKLTRSEVEKVSLSKPNVKGLVYKLNLSKNPYRYTISDMVRESNRDRQQVCSLISKELNISRDIVDRSAQSTTISDLLRYSNDKILVRTHKVFKQPLNVINNIGEMTIYERRNVVTDVISRVDEMRGYIKKLLSLDYWLIIELDDNAGELERKRSSLSKAEHLLSKKRDRLSREDVMKYSNNLLTLPREIRELEKKVARELNRYHNTGYYVNCDDDYPEKTYQEYLKRFDEAYEKIRNKLLRYNLDRIPYDNNKEITLLDALDSYQLVRRQKNQYVKISS